MNLNENEQTGASADRCYSDYSTSGVIDFCPHKDLNFPSSYEEVVNRFRKLQGERAIEILN